MEVRRPTSQPFPSQFTALQGILDFSKEFDVSLMDRVVMAFYTGAGQEVRVLISIFNSPDEWHLPQQQMAQQVLTQFQEHPDSWTRVPDILEHSSFPQTKVRQYCQYLPYETDAVLHSTLGSKSSRNSFSRGGSHYRRASGKVSKQTRPCCGVAHIYVRFPEFHRQYHRQDRVRRGGVTERKDLRQQAQPCVGAGTSPPPEAYRYESSPTSVRS